jgi:hypothetical protein
MPRSGAYVVDDLPEGLTAIHCPKCRRMGRYRRETLLARFGPDMALPDVLVKLAHCTRRRDMGDPCGVVYSEPLGRGGPRRPTPHDAG